MNGTLLQHRIENRKKDLTKEIRYIDVDYKGFNEKHVEDTIVYNGNALLNAYKVWLCSFRGDYLRKYNFGGFFQNLCNEWPYEPESADKIKNALIAATHEYWPTIKLIECEVKMAHKLSYPGWEVRVLPLETTTNMVGLEMYLNNTDIKITRKN